MQYLNFDISQVPLIPRFELLEMFHISSNVKGKKLIRAQMYRIFNSPKQSKFGKYLLLSLT